MNDDHNYIGVDMTMGEYLRGCVNYDIPDSAINTIFVDRHVAPDEDVSLYTTKVKELCKADLYMWCATTPSVKGGIEDADGGWKHKEAGIELSLYDKRLMRSNARAIYRKYGDSKLKSSINVHAGGMRLWRK